ncbi:hypothetical protein V1264_021973 [Littorina saxatilis]|uniref:Uncharacterized protein n=1 Tax=Littorina saxatilis TaxID=31220 RepID=A0AAN9AJA6_9CAEN
MPGGKCFFNPRWLEEKEYKDWIQRDCDKYKAFRKCCKARVDISVMGESALVLLLLLLSLDCRLHQSEDSADFGESCEDDLQLVSSELPGGSVIASGG